MKLIELVEKLGVGCNLLYPQTEIFGVSDNSKALRKGDLFLALPGDKTDGRDYIEEAVSKGASAIISHRKAETKNRVDIIVMEDLSDRICDILGILCPIPSADMKIIGITGTKGKTTTASFLYGILKGFGAVMIGTNGVFGLDDKVEINNTTPSVTVLYSLIHRAYALGKKFVIIEVSSQGIKCGRIGDIIFDLCIFTGISTDHIGEGEHETYEEYKECKLRLFDKKRCKCAVFDRRDDCAEEIEKRCEKSIAIWGDKKESVTPEHIISRYGSSAFSIDGIVYTIAMPGEFNVKNATLALCAASRLTSLPLARFRDKLKKIKVSGRYEVYEISGKTVIIDFAHNEDSVRKVLLEVRRKTLGKVIILYGSVGGRVKSRRKALAMTAERYADFSYITADNPGEESVREICNEIASYYEMGCYKIIPDRRTAILFAVDNMSCSDTLVLAGKGHEGYQLINGEKVPFSEKEILYSIGGDRVN